MVVPSSLLMLVSVALSPLALARPNALTMFKRQTSNIPSECQFTCTPVQEALSTCLVATCLCNSEVLDAFVNCSECTLHATNPSNLNESIASYQASIDAYRQTCASSPSAVALPNVTITSPPANATFPTASSNGTSANNVSSTASSMASSTASSIMSSASAKASSGSASVAARTSSTGVGAGASASASATSGTSGAERRMVLAGGVGAAVMGVMGLVVML